MFLPVKDAAERFKIPVPAYEDWEAGEAYPEEGAEEKLVYAYFPWLSGKADLLEKARAELRKREPAIEAAPPPPPGVPEFDSVEEAIRFAEKQGKLIVEDDDGPLTLGDALREARDNGALSREDLSEIMSVRESVLEKWEAGVSLPSLEEFEAIKLLFPELLSRMGGVAPKLVSKGEPPLAVLRRPRKAVAEPASVGWSELSLERERMWRAGEAWCRAEEELGQWRHVAKLGAEENMRLLGGSASPEEIAQSLKAAALYPLVEKLLKEAAADGMTCQELLDCMEAFE